jgi:hypothetical protein
MPTELRPSGMKYPNPNEVGDYVQNTANLSTITIPWAQVTGARTWQINTTDASWLPGRNNGAVGNCGDTRLSYQKTFNFDAGGGKNFDIYYTAINCTNCANCNC